MSTVAPRGGRVWVDPGEGEEPAVGQAFGGAGDVPDDVAVEDDWFAGDHGVFLVAQLEPDQHPVARPRGCVGGEAGFGRGVLRAGIDAEGRDAVGDP